ncbi:type I-E CRISPR-associated protein Cas7/Cse4/CasC [Jonesiaceae bacterium BS-20]|uniref:Type I-E CRISPR-associated protein Cas7/Cse4/CasC n=1 Tax=Jonesiaceae bacterium BS-20 TaxID=3120821 RepID=A0AAU7DUB5_9MICO
MSKNLYVELHALQPIPPSNVNRDDTGNPKTAIFGGIRRARVSSQAWKRSIRQDFANRLAPELVGVRSVRLVEKLASEIRSQYPELTDEAQAMAVDVFTTANLKVSKPKPKKNQETEPIEVTGYLVFLSNQQLSSIAELAGKTVIDGGEIKSLKKELLQRLKFNNSYDLALFGRMVADNTDLNVEAAAQVAHAIGVSKVETEFDYYTAVDDVKAASEEETDAGAAMIGSIAFNSSTVYRYANINVSELARNLGDAAGTAGAIREFVRSFVTAMPTGKQNSFANRTLPTSLVVTLRSDQPISLAPAFETPLYPSEERSISVAAAARLAEYAGELYEAFGATPEMTWVQGVGDAGKVLEELGDRVALPELLAAVEQAAVTFAEENLSA